MNNEAQRGSRLRGRVVASAVRDRSGVARAGAGTCGGVDAHTGMDRFNVPYERGALRSHALPPHGTVYLLLIVPTLAVGWIDAPTTACILLAAVILVGGKVIWWLTEQAWGRRDNAAD